MAVWSGNKSKLAFIGIIQQVETLKRVGRPHFPSGDTRAILLYLLLVLRYYNPRIKSNVPCIYITLMSNKPLFYPRVPTY